VISDTGSPDLRLDTRLSLETPEGATLPLVPAGMGARIMAFLVDFLIKFGVSFIAMLILTLIGQFGAGLALIILFLLEWFYPVYFEVWHQGVTPGKKSLKLRVINDDGTPITFGPSLLRNLLRVADFLPFMYLSGVITSVIHPHFKRLGDLAAGTLVVYDAAPLTVPDFEAKGRRAVPADFSTDEQRALLTFAERSNRLTPERQQELAAILAPVLKTQDPVNAIKQMAKTMVGRQ
jgi:uncharacterized RDD family membrane protein YckC